MLTSKLHMLTLGIVAQDRSLNSTVIKVYPIEIIPNVDGELVPSTANLEGSGLDLNDNEYAVTVNISNYIEADWLSLSTNRTTAPNVVKGEQVIVWNYADTDQYYWTSMGRDDSLRKLETVVYHYSNVRDNLGDTPKSQANQYTIEVSTHGKHITVKTAKNDNEPFLYTLQINTHDGCVFIKDDVGNIILLDSKNTNITHRNKDDSLLSLHKKDITISCKNNISMKCTNDCTIDCGNAYTLSAGASASIGSGGPIDINAGAAIAMSAAGISMTSASYRSGAMRFTGNVSVIGQATFSDSLTAKTITATDFYGNFHGTLFGSIA